MKNIEFRTRDTRTTLIDTNLNITDSKEYGKKDTKLAKSLSSEVRKNNNDTRQVHIKGTATLLPLFSVDHLNANKNESINPKISSELQNQHAQNEKQIDLLENKIKHHLSNLPKKENTEKEIKAAINNYNALSRPKIEEYDLVLNITPNAIAKIKAKGAKKDQESKYNDYSSDIEKYKSQLCTLGKKVLELSNKNRNGNISKLEINKDKAFIEKVSAGIKKVPANTNAKSKRPLTTLPKFAKSNISNKSNTTKINNSEQQEDIAGLSSCNTSSTTVDIDVDNSSEHNHKIKDSSMSLNSKDHFILDDANNLPSDQKTDGINNREGNLEPLNSQKEQSDQSADNSFALIDNNQITDPQVPPDGVNLIEQLKKHDADINKLIAEIEKKLPGIPDPKIANKLKAEFEELIRHKPDVPKDPNVAKGAITHFQGFLNQLKKLDAKVDAAIASKSPENTKDISQTKTNSSSKFQKALLFASIATALAGIGTLIAGAVRFAQIQDEDFDKEADQAEALETNQIIKAEQEEYRELLIQQEQEYDAARQERMDEIASHYTSTTIITDSDGENYSIPNFAANELTDDGKESIKDRVNQARNDTVENAKKSASQGYIGLTTVGSALVLAGAGLGGAAYYSRRQAQTKQSTVNSLGQDTQSTPQLRAYEESAPQLRAYEESAPQLRAYEESAPQSIKNRSAASQQTVSNEAASQSSRNRSAASQQTVSNEAAPQSSRNRSVASQQTVSNEAASQSTTDTPLPSIAPFSVSELL